MDEDQRREVEATYEAIVADLSAEDRSALIFDRLLYSRAVVERSADGRARRVPPSEWTDIRASAREET